MSLILLPNFDVFCDLLGSLSKRDTDDNENVIGRHNFAFLQSFLSYSSRYACKMCSTILKLYWNQRFRSKKTKLNICHHMLTSSTQLQNRSFHVVKRKRTALKCQILKNARARRAKLLFFVAYLWRSCFRRHRGFSSSLLLNRRTATWNRSICFIHYFPIVHNAPCLPPKFWINYCCEILLEGLHIPKTIPQQ